jgi:hypothetical protein
MGNPASERVNFFFFYFFPLYGKKSNSSFSMWMLRQFERSAIVRVVDQN